MSTYGQRAVGLSFNPSDNPLIDHTKVSVADLIDLMDRLRTNSGSAEQGRLASIAITELQTAQMWAVKALTWKDEA
jgi:hypothetical protein